MPSRNMHVLRTIACVVDILLVLLSSIIILVFSSSEESFQITLGLFAIAWGYAIPNLGAINAVSRRWRFVWSIPAVLGNLGFLGLAGNILLNLDLVSILPGFLLPILIFVLILLVLVLLNTLAIFLRPFPPRDVDGIRLDNS